MVYVNIVDLIDARRTGVPAASFPSKRALRSYSKTQNKIFPKAEAKRDGFVKALLIDMF
jgi:hypothetical protein